MPAPTPRGRFVWHELMTTDPRAAARFYKAVMGWRTQRWEQDPSYTLWLTADGPLGGLMALPDDAKRMGAPPNWLAYVGTPEIDATVDRAMALGARVITGPLDVPGAGRFAVMADPQGAVFAPYRAAAEPPGHQGDPRLGEFSWHELATTDPVAALAFYSDLFGWEKTEAMDAGPPLGVYQMYGLQGKSMGGIYTKPAEQPGPPYWLCYALVRDAVTAAGKVRALGGKVLNGPMQVPGGDWIAQCLDPQGAAFAVHSLPRPVAAKGTHSAPATPARKPRTASRAHAAPRGKRRPRRKPATRKRVKRTTKRRPRKAARRPRKR
jgi:predicted enzyme related to lactoylglutathione lyase